MVVINPIIWF